MPSFRTPKPTNLYLALSFVACFAGPVAAQAATPAATPTPEAVSKQLPNNPTIQEVRVLPNSNLLELRMGKSELYYADTNLKYLIKGELMELPSGKNITQERIAALEAIPFKSLSLADSFTIVKGKGEREFANFEDPNCGFCKKLTKSLLDLDNVKVHVFLYPILGPDSVKKSQNIWCAKDKAATYEAWMLKGVTPPEAVCDTSALDRNKQFGLQSSIRGTPAIVFKNGKRINGFMEAPQIEAILAKP